MAVYPPGPAVKYVTDAVEDAYQAVRLLNPVVSPTDIMDLNAALGKMTELLKRWYTSGVS